MKSNSIQSILMSLFIVGIAITSFSSCKKDNDTNPKTLKEQLAGKWNVTSFKLGDTEYMGTIVNSATIEYDSFSGTQGNFRQAVVLADNTNMSTSGKYEVNETTKTVKMNTIDEEIIATIIVKDDKLEWVSDQDGEDLIIKASRK